ncbi:MAG: chorismate mutase [Marinilabiliales bacterium]|nr:chorismate mutase [Marinilabiliales bacterium]
MRVSEKIGIYKKDKKMTALQTSRWNEILRNGLSEGTRMGLRGEVY